MNRLGLKIATTLLSLAAASSLGCNTETPITETNLGTATSELSLSLDSLLVRNLEDLRRVALGAPRNLFGYSDTTSRVSPQTCAFTDVTAVSKKFNSMVDEVVATGDRTRAPQLTDAEVSYTKGLFGSLLGSGNYLLCESRYIGQFGRRDVTTVNIINLDSSGIRVTLQRGNVG
jgi:hypothetical protein